MRALVATVLRRASRRSLVVLLTGLDDAALAEGLLTRCSARCCTGTRCSSPGWPTRGVAAMAAGRGDAEAVYGAAAAAVALAERRDVAARLPGGAASRWSTRPPTTSPRRSPTATSRSRPAGRL